MNKQPKFPVGTVVYSHVFRHPDIPKRVCSAEWDGAEYRYAVEDENGVVDTGYLEKDFSFTGGNRKQDRIDALRHREKACWEMAGVFLHAKDAHGLHDMGVEIQGIQWALRELEEFL